MSDLNLELESLSTTLDIGDTVRTVCPVCNGGSNNEATFSVTQSETGVLYQCFRNKCQTRGVYNSTGIPTTGSKRKLERELKQRKRMWEGEVQDIPKSVLKIISERWGIEDPPHWYFTRDYGGRIAFSVRSPRNVHRGYQLRQISEESKWPKALTYINEGENGLSWYRNFLDKPCVLVEDIPSAVRASKYVNAVALLGTMCSVNSADEIRQHTHGRVYVALDNDATAQALKLAKRYALLWGDVSVLPLTHDMKDMNEESLCKLLSPLS